MWTLSGYGSEQIKNNLHIFETTEGSKYGLVTTQS